MKKKKLPELITILILTLIVVVFWMFFTVYRVFTNKPASVVEEEIIQPLNASFDSQTMQEIQDRSFFE